MASRVRRGSRTDEIWPGFVDALSTLLMVFIFLLVVFMLAQYFLSVALSGKDETLNRLSRQVNELADLLSLERKANAELRLDIAQLSSELQSSTADRDSLSAQLAFMAAENEKTAARLSTVVSERDALVLRLEQAANRGEFGEADAQALRAALAEADRTIAADRETIEIKLAELASLRQDVAVLHDVREELEAQIVKLAEVLAANRDKLADADAARESLELRNQVIVLQIGDVEKSLEASLAEGETMRTDLAGSQAALEKSRSAFKISQTELARSLQSISTLRTDVSRLTIEFTTERDRTKELVARLSTSVERTALAQNEIEEREIRFNELRLAMQQSDEELSSQRQLSSKAQAQVELLNRQLAALRKSIARIAAALEVSEAEVKDKKIVIANLGSKLNLALASKVEELQKYRSDFFGRLRELLGNRQGIRVEGDRFVFQSEVLFGSGSAHIEAAGQASMDQLAESLIAIAKEIPDEISWILRVDGHTDKIPINTPQFASNWELSTARAISVVRYLIERGVKPDRLAATGFGEFQPIDPHEDEIALRRNRRIELKLTTR